MDENCNSFNQNGTFSDGFQTCWIIRINRFLAKRSHEDSFAGSWKGSWNLETPNLSWYKRSHNHHHWFYYPNKIMMYLPWFSVKSWRSVVLTSSLLTHRICFQLDESTFFARKPNWHFLLHLNPLGRTSCGVTLNVLKLQPWVNTRKC